MSELVFARENGLEVFDEALPLVLAHYQEIATWHDIPLDPDLAAYAEVERAGMLRTYCARNAYGQLVGYAVFLVRHNLHYRQSKQALQDVLYLDPAYRGRALGLRFIRWCDEQLAAEGVQVVYQHVKRAHDFGPLLERLGYQPLETTYARRLD